MLQRERVIFEAKRCFKRRIEIVSTPGGAILEGHLKLKKLVYHIALKFSRLAILARTDNIKSAK